MPGATVHDVSLLKRVPPAVLFVGVASCWGLNSVAMRVAGRYVPPLTVAAVRSVVGGVLLLALARSQKASWPRGKQEWVPLAALAFFMTGLTTACLFLAAKNAPAGLVSIFTNTMPLFVAMLAPALLQERITSRVMFGVSVGLVGAVVVAWRAIAGEVRPIGVFYGLAGAFASAFGSVLYKRYPLPRLDRTMVIGVQLAISSLVLGVLAIPDDRSNMQVRWQLVVSFVYLAVVGLALSFVMYSELISRASAMQTSAVSYLATVVGVLAGAVLLHERLSWLVLIGGVIAIAGVAIVQTAQYRDRLNEQIETARSKVPTNPAGLPAQKAEP
jgi:drug/metabolite transporter (DMT)-like permease